jgi:type II secretory ATPase GspE/PulE/Tfp pilus assembly ATPase PilB-like protein
MIDEGRRIDEQNTISRARLLNMPYVDTSVQELKLYPDILPLAEMYSLKIVPIKADAHNIQFGVTNATSQIHMNDLKQRFSDQQVGFAVISDIGYRDLMRRYDPPKAVVYQDIALAKADSSEQFSAVSATLNSVRADDMLAYIVQQAYQLKASDIHLENTKDGIRIRYRVDGVLHPVAEMTKEKYHMLISSMAVAANISTNTTEAQTGRINQSYQLADGSQTNVNLRVETVPALYGMDIVLRLFTLDPALMRLDRLDFNEAERAVINDIIKHPTGLVLAVGPTGSGKTTTLYSIINELNAPERKIITLEDPVEYYIKGITQIPIDSAKNENGFAEGFRAVLRLDPDVIMVGEIRDSDTAKTALQSALTGHLVLSTYHASSACAALTRLLDAIGDNPLFTSALRLVAAQRLVRRLDDKIKKPYVPDEKTKEWLKGVIDTLPPDVAKPSLDNVQLYQPGASEENPFGYSGQIAIRELLIMNPALSQELRRPANEITTDSLQQVAISNGMLTMLQDGVLRALSGETSLQEVLRVIG